MWLPSLTRPVTLLQSGTLQTGAPILRKKYANWNCIGSPNGKCQTILICTLGDLPKTSRCHEEPDALFLILQYLMFLRVKAWTDSTREEKVSSRQQTPWQLQTATSLHSQLQPGGPQSSQQVRYDGAQVQRNPSTHCSPKGGQHRERRWAFHLAKVHAGTPAHDQILDKPPQLLLAKIFTFSANQSYIKKITESLKEIEKWL